MLQDYYNRRAQEYEEIYHRPDPVRQKEIAQIGEAMKDVLSNRCVFEIACGTGFWTVIASEVAEHILAIDISDEMLSIAGAKNLPDDRVNFCIGDAYSLESIEGEFDAGLANFWLSHIPKARLNDFLHNLNKKLGFGAVVFMADNVYVPGIGGELIKKDNCEDTFKLRKLSNGSKYEVLKNYYDENQLRKIFEPFSREFSITIENCFWWCSYITP